MEEKNIYLLIYEGDGQALRQLLDGCKRSMFDRALSLSGGSRDDAIPLMKRAVSAVQKRLTTEIYLGTKETLIADAFASALLSPGNSDEDTATSNTAAPEEHPKPLVQSYADKHIHPALLILMIILAMLLLWVLTGLLMRIGWLEFRDIGYIWFDKAIFPLFTGAVV